MGILMVRKEDAVLRQHKTSGGLRRSFDYFGRASGNGSGLEAFMNEADNRTLLTHCHPVDQFQIFFGVSGSLYQRRSIPPVMVHYVDAYGTYGPIVGTDPPLRFLVLRTEESQETIYIPKDRARVPYLSHRQMHIEPEELWAENEIPPGVVRVNKPVSGYADGLEILTAVAGPSTEIAVPATHGTSGQYVLVLQGAIELGNTVFGEEALGWQSPGERSEVVKSGPSGSAVLVLRFPSPPS